MLREIESTHHETEHDIEHCQERHCVIFAKGLNQHKGHLEDILDNLNDFGSAVSSLGEVDVLFPIIFQLESEMSKEGLYKKVGFFECFGLTISIPQINDVGRINIEHEGHNDGLTESKLHERRVLDPVEVDEVLALVNQL